MESFAEELAICGLGNSAIGTDEDGNILVEISYEKDVDELEAYLDELCEQMDEEDDEDKNEDEDDDK